MKNTTLSIVEQAVKAADRLGLLVQTTINTIGSYTGLCARIAVIGAGTVVMVPVALLGRAIKALERVPGLGKVIARMREVVSVRGDQGLRVAQQAALVSAMTLALVSAEISFAVQNAWAAKAPIEVSEAIVMTDDETPAETKAEAPASTEELSASA